MNPSFLFFIKGSTEVNTEKQQKPQAELPNPPFQGSFAVKVMRASFRSSKIIYFLAGGQKTFRRSPTTC